ncbi:helix-turn-helix transcriptional regulator [Shewanella marina]|uniref:helix-turn-helix transcriptional regulator n=1 Tax=Shewanella marina TaxID=487319 RepID=UPI000472A890|nr:helix-turn-helix domain-containing protein [Shewanella marina]
MKYSGAELREIRKKADYTQQELATRLGISRETLIKIETDSPSAVIKMEIVNRWWQICRPKLSHHQRGSFKLSLIKFFDI